MISKNPFQCDDATRMPLTRPVNYAHSAAADLIQDLVIAQAPVGVAHIHVHGTEECVGSGSDDDLVLPSLVDEDQGDAGVRVRLVDPLHARQVDLRVC